MKKSKRSPILEELLSESPEDIEERVKKLSEMILEGDVDNNLRKVYNKMKKENRIKVLTNKAYWEEALDNAEYLKLSNEDIAEDIVEKIIEVTKAIDQEPESTSIIDEKVSSGYRAPIFREILEGTSINTELKVDIVSGICVARDVLPEEEWDELVEDIKYLINENDDN